MKVVFLDPSSTSPRGSDHANNYRVLVHELSRRDHDVIFCECGSLYELAERHVADVGEANLVVVGSHMPEGVAIAEWVLKHAPGVIALYDVDTPATLEELHCDDGQHLSPQLVDRFDLYLSSIGGRTLGAVEDILGARHAIAFAGLVDPKVHRPLVAEPRWDLGYLATYGEHHQSTLERLLIEPAWRGQELELVVGNLQRPEKIGWPPNVDRIEHVSIDERPAFYSSQRFTLNVAPTETREAGWSPSMRLFEAAACGVPVISDRWDGLEEIFTPDEEILVADSPEDVLDFLREVGENERRGIADRARRRVLTEHTAERRCQQLETEVAGVIAR